MLRIRVPMTVGLSPWSPLATVGGGPQSLWLGPLSPSPKAAKAAGSFSPWGLSDFPSSLWRCPSRFSALKGSHDWGPPGNPGYSLSLTGDDLNPICREPARCQQQDSLLPAPGTEEWMSCLPRVTGSLCRSQGCLCLTWESAKLQSDAGAYLFAHVLEASPFGRAETASRAASGSPSRAAGEGCFQAPASALFVP